MNHKQELVLRLADSTELLRFSASGDVTVRGQAVTELSVVHDAVLEWVDAAFRASAEPALRAVYDISGAQAVLDVRGGVSVLRRPVRGGNRAVV
jgi:hypothetical protein